MQQVVLLCGGRSAEHEISLLSVKSIAENLDRKRFRPSLIGIRRDGSTYASEELKESVGLDSPEEYEFPSTRHWVSYLTELDPDSVIVFPVLHGPFGEDGTVQGVLEVLDLAYVGPSVGPSAVGMSKIFTKSVLESNGLPVLPWVAIRRDEASDLASALEKVWGDLQPPVFVKPACMGSSIGISRCTDSDELKEGISLALNYDDHVLVEQGVEAREIEVSVLGGFKPCASIPGEIIPGDVFYSYSAKYLDDSSKLLIPAPLSEEVAYRVRELAVAVFETLQLEGMARVDFLLERTNDLLWINEPNTIPGFTKISMFPKLWEKSGLPFRELLSRLVSIAVERRLRRAKLRTDRL